MSKDVVLSFSGGLDTSFCVPYLQEQGYAVHTVFANTGGVSPEELAYIEQRAAELLGHAADMDYLGASIDALHGQARKPGN